MSPTAEILGSRAFWSRLLAGAAVEGGRRWRHIGLGTRLVASGEMARMVSAYASGNYVPRPPTAHHLNKADGRKKTVYTFAPADDLFFKALNRALAPAIERFLSPLCHSFRPGRGPRSAYRELRAVAGLDAMACLHVDVRDYFNSIPIAALLRALPDVIAQDRALMRLLAVTLGADPSRGVMAGTPLAPLLSNLYLGPLDAAFEPVPATYLRYADDIAVFAPPAEIAMHREAIEVELHALGLELNRRKTRLSAPGEVWEFLGLRYRAGHVDVAPHTVAKLRRRVRRLARRAIGHDDPCRYAIRRLNRRLYGVGGRSADFSWAGWFFPLLSDDRTLRGLDRLVQEQLRFAVTGRHEKRNFRAVPYTALRAAGYVPLAAAFQAYRRGVGAYEALIAGRTAGVG